MSRKSIFLSFLLITLCGAAMAQDRIFRSNGAVTEGKVRSAAGGTIIYNRYDNPNGPEYSIRKGDVDKIKYQDGTEQNFGRERYNNDDRFTGRRQDNTVPGLNNSFHGRLRPDIWAFAPVQFTENGVAGFSVSYEHALDNNSVFAFYLPAICEFNINNNNNGYTNNNSDPMFYLMPGIKIYPTGGFGLAKYAIGPSLVIADGQKTTYDNPYMPYGETHNHFVFGMMLNQSVNVNPTPRLYLGSEFGFGFSYLNKLSGNTYTINPNLQGLVQFSFKIGYRF